MRVIAALDRGERRLVAPVGDERQRLQVDVEAGGDEAIAIAQARKDVGDLARRLAHVVDLGACVHDQAAQAGPGHYDRRCHVILGDDVEARQASAVHGDLVAIIRTLPADDWHRLRNGIAVNFNER